MAENKKPQFSTRDMEVSAMVWACLGGDIKIDFDKLATLGGYKNAASARECWRTTKIRLLAAAGVDKDGKTKDQPETPKNKATAAKGAAKGTASTATKRKRATKKTAAAPVIPVAAAAAAADSNDDYEGDAHDDAAIAANGAAGDGSPVHPKKKSRTAAGGASAGAASGSRKKKAAPKSEEIIMEPVYDEDEEQQIQQLNLAGGHGTSSLEDDIVGVDAMIKAEEEHVGAGEMPMAVDEV
ncbi:hypothetical protein PG997_014969 [Apiospora hydei]|uniref:Uncharacterized protein n=1 Tax=Apiospora hydei TaxID=1337664 RepID=A0ABR1UW21_9PEZI